MTRYKSLALLSALSMGAVFSSGCAALQAGAGILQGKALVEDVRDYPQCWALGLGAGVATGVGTHVSRTDEPYNKGGESVAIGTVAGIITYAMCRTYYAAKRSGASDVRLVGEREEMVEERDLNSP
jgi:hypothetical protein